MKTSIIALCACCLSLFSPVLQAVDMIKDNSTGEVFPREIAIDHEGKHYELEATGVTTRKKLVIKIYGLASYLQKNPQHLKQQDKYEAIFSDDNAKQITMKWVRDVSLENLQETYRESFRKVLTAQEYAQQQNDIEKYITFFTWGAHKGDEFINRWLPGGYVEVLINGNRVGSITNKAFAKGLWSIWFGNKSVVDRVQLTSLLK